MPLSEDQQPPRKKIRKGTRSCWECKHRKVRCHFASDGDRSCRECLVRGLLCRTQDLPKPENPRESDRASLNDRLARVESLLERFMQRYDGDTDQSFPRAAGDNNGPVSSPTAATPAHENAPVLSLFDNEVLGFRRQDVTTVPNISLYWAANRDWKRLSRTLFVALPSQDTLEKLAETSSCWWLVRAQCFQDYETSLLSIPVADLSNSHPVVIATTLMWTAISLQQLPPNYDTSFLELPCHPTKLIEQYINLVVTSVCSDEAMVSNINGLECLVLQGIFYNNDGKLRSAWLSYRRALDVAQIIGLHRPLLAGSENSESLHRARSIWKHIIYADRYLSLMLGMYHGIGDAALERQEDNLSDVPNSSSMDLLCRVAGSIIERNQNFPTVTPIMVRMTQTIDSKLGTIDPPMVEEYTLSTAGKSAERAQYYAKLMTQLWYYQLMAWLHLPFLLETGSQGRYDYSRQSCLQASRHMITSYTAIRRLTADSFCCKSLDFQAFTAAVTLMISVLGPNGRTNQSPDDLEAVGRVIQILEELTKGSTPDKVATRGLSVLQTLKRVATGKNPIQPVSPEGQSNGEQPSHIKVDIPYFGTIVLDRRTRASSSQQDISDHGLPPAPGNGGPGTNGPSASKANLMEHNSAQMESGLSVPLTETSLDFEPAAEIWTLHPDLIMQPSFVADLGDNWDLGL
ncbi:hypothetical protein N7474_001747 [Penicillium riverlandense]|uniref:uncharacterized protein n=1 Tax=Penicillium riverlandense TaxID=1903569 RepID=UPI002549BB37|nr:uncharacterized protein N7474_001747 [Penicillium riverlandense]KAJ5833436.1 hypothetical protein N7474_001747 [Penicillium riverlandense]